LFEQLGIELVKTEMSFSFSDRKSDFEWSGTSMNTLFGQRRNILNGPMLRGLFDMLKFNKEALRRVQEDPSLTLGALTERMKLKSWFKDHYLLPMGGAIWSCSSEAMLDFPAASFVNFFHNHGLLSLRNRPQWYTLKDKSTSYVESLRASIEEKGTIIKNPKKNKFSEKFRKLLRKIIKKIRDISIKFIAQNIEN
jgi:predicted NAD/FAD-binding protein